MSSEGWQDRCMIVLKSTTVGIAAAFFVFLLTLLGITACLWATYKVHPGLVQGDPISLSRPSIWVVTTVVFLIGFAWELRRACSK